MSECWRVCPANKLDGKKLVSEKFFSDLTWHQYPPVVTALVFVVKLETYLRLNSTMSARSSLPFLSGENITEKLTKSQKSLRADWAAQYQPNQFSHLLPSLV